MRPKPPRAVTITIFTTITIVFWVFFSVYRILTSEPTPQVPPSILESLDPSLDTAALESLPQRLYFTNEEIIEFRNASFGINEVGILFEEEVDTSIVEPENDSTESSTLETDDSDF